jgi:hypothetical protein
LAHPIRCPDFLLITQSLAVNRISPHGFDAPLTLVCGYTDLDLRFVADLHFG